MSLSEGERRVLLPRGEAFFDVAKNPSGRTFVVLGGTAEVRVLGTKSASLEGLWGVGHSTPLSIIGSARLLYLSPFRQCFPPSKARFDFRFREAYAVMLQDLR